MFFFFSLGCPQTESFVFLWVQQTRSFVFLWALQTGSFVSSGHYRQEVLFPLGTTDRKLLSSGHYRQEVAFLWALQTGSFVFLWALHSQDLLCFKSGLSTDRKFSSTAESTVRIFYVFLWALHSQDV